MKNNSKFSIPKVEDQLIIFEHDEATIASVKVYPGKDAILFLVNPKNVVKSLPVPVVKLFGSSVKFNPLNSYQTLIAFKTNDLEWDFEASELNENMNSVII